jgi:triacylglycerol lipase
MMRSKRTLIWGLTIVACATAVAAKTPESPLMPESSLPMKKTVPVFGQRIAYYDIGSGPVVVLVHGFASEARFDWGNVILPLAKRHRVIALDQIGFGASDIRAVHDRST